MVHCIIRCTLWTGKPILAKHFYNFNEKKFLQSNYFLKIFTRNLIKNSYICMRNVTPIIASDNTSILQANANEDGCSFTNKESRPLPN